MSEVYSSLKPLLFADHVKALRDGRAIAPVHIRIKPINACNHHCWFCAYRVEQLDLGGQMKIKDRIPREKMLEIADDIVEMGVKAVTFSGGGEPLIYPHIVETVERLAQGNVRVASLTNGAFLKGDIARVFAQHGTWVRVSMDGWNGESYAKARGVKDDEFEKVLTNLKAFLALGTRCTLGVSFIINERNASHVFEFCERVKAIGVKHVKLAGCVVGNNGAENNRYHAGFFGVVRDQIALAARLNDADFSVIDHYHEMNERFDKDYGTCPALRYLTIIGADCSVYTCQDKAYTDSGRLGSIKDRPFKDFWFSPENTAAMAALNPKESCRHHCVSHAKNELLLEALKLDQEHLNFV